MFFKTVLHIWGPSASYTLKNVARARETGLRVRASLKGAGMAIAADGAQDGASKGRRNRRYTKAARGEAALRALGASGEEELSPEAAAQWREALRYSSVGYLRTVGRVTSSHAEDIWQHTLVQTWRTLRDRGPVQNIRAYMKTICARETAKHLKKLKERADSLIGDAASVPAVEDAHTPASMRELHRKAKEMAEGLKGLGMTPREAEALILHKAYGLDATTVGSLLVPQATAGAVRTAASTALAKLNRPGMRKQVLFRLGATD